MAKILIDEEMGQIIYDATHNIEIIDDADAYRHFLEELAELICNHFGGVPGAVGEPAKDKVQISHGGTRHGVATRGGAWLDASRQDKIKISTNDEPENGRTNLTAGDHDQGWGVYTGAIQHVSKRNVFAMLEWLHEQQAKPRKELFNQKEVLYDQNRSINVGL